MVEAGIGGATVDELNNTMSVSEFVRWHEYDEMFPIGFSDLHFGRLMQLIASVYSPKGSNTKLKNYLLGNIPDAKTNPNDLEEKLDKIESVYGGSNEN